MTDNPVTVVFTDGTELDVEIVARLVGAEWMYAQLCTNPDKSEDEKTERDEIILQADEVRYIQCANTATEHDPNARVHHGNDRGSEVALQQLYDLYKAQHQIHPSDDPSAFPESERGWPPDEPTDTPASKQVQ